MRKGKKLCIVGVGGFGREVFSSFIETFKTSGKNIVEEVFFMDDNPIYKGKKVMDLPVIQKHEFNPTDAEVVIAVGDPETRMKVANSLPKETQYATLIHPSAILMADYEIGEGGIITAGSILTCNIKIGKHCHLNLNTTVGHDCRIGDYFTTAPGVHISGECNIGNLVYFGTNASVRQGIEITDRVTIGMGGIVVKNIIESGIYIGNPTKKLER